MNHNGPQPLCRFELTSGLPTIHPLSGQHASNDDVTGDSPATDGWTLFAQRALPADNREVFEETHFVLLLGRFRRSPLRNSAVQLHSVGLAFQINVCNILTVSEGSGRTV